MIHIDSFLFIEEKVQLLAWGIHRLIMLYVSISQQEPGNSSSEE